MSIFFIRRPVFAFVLSMVIVLVGGICIFTLPISQFPQITPPVVQVSTSYPGASAQVVEQTVATQIEQQVNGCPQMIYMQSVSTSSGTYQLNVSFAVGSDPNIDAVNVQNRVSAALASLPSAVNNFGVTITPQSPSMLMVLTLYSPTKAYDSTFLSNYAAINVINPLMRVPGIGNNLVIGQQNYAMRVWVDPQKLAKLSLQATDISDALKSQNIIAPAGQVGAPPSGNTSPAFQYTINGNGELNTTRQFDNIVVRSNPDGSILRIRDIARTELGAQTYYSFGRQNGVPANIILLYQTPTANALATAQGVRTEMDLLAKSFPSGLKYSVMYDNTEFVKESIKDVEHTLFEAIGLVLLVVLLFLGSWRAALIPMIAVPVSLIGTFAVFVPLGFNINTLTLFGMVLAIGLVVDDAIVVVEAVEHHIEQGLSPRAATEQAMRDVQAPVIGIAIVLGSVFVPVAFIGGIIGQLYQQFALTLAVSVAISAVVALTLTPVLCEMLLRPKKEGGGKDPFSWFFRKFNVGFQKMTGGYMSAVRLLLRRSFIVIVLLLVVYLGAGYLVVKTPTAFVPQEDQGAFFVIVNLPDGSSLARTDQLSEGLESAFEKIPGVETVATLGGLNLLTNAFTSESCSFVLALKPWGDRTTKQTSLRTIIGTAQYIVSKQPGMTGVAVNISPIPGLGSSSGIQFEIEDRGSHTPQQLADVADTFGAKMAQQPSIGPGFNSLRAYVPQLNIAVDRDKTETLGIPFSDVYSNLGAYFGGPILNDFILFDRSWKVMIQSEAQFRAGPPDITKVYVRNKSGSMVPMSTLASVTPTVGANVIQRFNAYRESELTVNPAAGYSTGQVIDTLTQGAAKDLPTGYGYEWNGLAYQQLLAGNSQIMAFVLALILVFLVLAALYESWAIPFGVLLAIPIGVLGAYILTVAVKNNANVYVQIALVMLIGLAAKNAILIVEFAKEKHDKEGMSAIDAALAAAQLRFRPILMTSIAFIVGSVPLALATGAGANGRHSIGTAVVGGMTLATLLGVFVIPVLYAMIQNLVDPKSRKTAGKHDVDGTTGTAVIPATAGGSTAAPAEGTP